MSHKQAVLLGLVCGAFAAAACSPASAGDVPSAAAKDKDDIVQVPPLDEIIIRGRREKLSRLKAEVLKAKEAFYDAFDQVNTVKEYETHCDSEVPVDTHIAARVCNPEFVHAATSDEAMSVLEGYPGRPASMVISAKMPAYHQYVHDLVHQSPKLRKVLGRYYALSKHYEAVRKEKFKGKWFVWD